MSRKRTCETDVLYADRGTMRAARRLAGHNATGGDASALGPSQVAVGPGEPREVAGSRFNVQRGSGRNDITEIEKEWLDRARRTVLVALQTHFGVAKDQATDAVDDAARRVHELLKHGLGFPYATSVLMHVSRLAHERLNRYPR